MILKTQLHPTLHRFFAPTDGEGNDLGGDRGDNWTPTDENDHTDLKSKIEKDDSKKDDETKAAEEAAAEESKATEESKAAEDEDDKKETKKDTRLPLSRHKEILDAERARREAVERELAKYREGERIAATNEEITAVEEKLVKADADYAKLIADGEMEKAAAKMREIRAMEREVNEKKADMRIAAAEARAVEQVRYDALVDRMEEAYPQLNPQDDNFSKEKTAEVLEMKAAFQATGHTPSQALQRAIKYVMGATTKAQKAATEVTPRVDADEAAKAKADARAAEQRKKNLDAAEKQPPDLKKVGQDSDKMGGNISAKDVLKMSQEDFAKLDEKTLAKMRGDEIEA